MPTAKLFISLLCFSLLTLSVTARPYVLVLSQEDFKDEPPSDPDSSPEWDEFGDSDSHKSEEDLDPGSWRQIFEPTSTQPQPQPQSDTEALYYSAVTKLMTGDARLIEEGSGEIETAAESGYPAAQSVLGFLWGMGLLRERSKQKAFVYHHFASDGGNMQSKMALAYTYTRQDMFDKSVKLYAELAEVAVNGFLISKDSPVIEPIRLHNGAEENKEALRKSKGEEDEDFQILEYQAQKGNAAAMYKVGLFYYFGLRGLRRDHSKALSWFLKAVEKGEPRSMELLGEIYARGAGVERNYTKAFEWLTLASKHHLYSAYNGIGYLYVKGYGVDSKNYTKAKEYFEKAAENDEVGGHYNLGVMFLKGIGVKRDVRLACKYFIVAANNGQPKAFYQLAKIFHLGVGFKKNVPLALVRKTTGEGIGASKLVTMSDIELEQGQLDNKEKPKRIPLTRLAKLNKPEVPVILLGSIAAIIHGVVFPIFGLLFSSVISMFFKPPDQQRKESRLWSLLYVGLGFVTLVVLPLQNYFFGIAGGKLIERVCSLTFEKIVHQEIRWFDNPANSSGAVGARLSTDASTVKSLVGFSFLALYCTNAFTFYIGSILVQHGKATFQEVFRVFFCLTMTAISVSQSSALAPDANKAKDSTASIFEILDSKPDIDSSSKEGVMQETVVGNIELQHVSFNYPTRPHIQIFRDLNLSIPSAKVNLSCQKLCNIPQR